MYPFKPNNADKQQALYQGLLALGSNLMAAGGPTTTPGGMLAPLANAGGAFTQASQGYLNAARDRQMQEHQIGRQAEADRLAKEAHALRLAQDERAGEMQNFQINRLTGADERAIEAHNLNIAQTGKDNEFRDAQLARQLGNDARDNKIFDLKLAQHNRETADADRQRKHLEALAAINQSNPMLQAGILAGDSTALKRAYGPEFGYKERDVPMVGGMMQKQVSIDNGRTWSFIGEPHHSRDPIIVHDVKGPDGSVSTQASSRAALEANFAGQAPTGSAAGVPGLQSVTLSESAAPVKVPEGMSLDDQGQLVPTPGGPVERQNQEAMAATERMIRQIDKLDKHPGRETATGFSSFLSDIPGTEARNFAAELETLKSQAFLPMVQQLKGMGQLSNAEGDKLTAAIGALDPTMTEAAFQASLQQIRGDFVAALSRMRGDGPVATAPPNPGGGAFMWEFDAQGNLVPSGQGPGRVRGEF